MAQENKAQASEIRYLNPVSVDVKKKKYCRFKKLGIKYVDYKDGEFLKKFLNEQGKILPRRLKAESGYSYLSYYSYRASDGYYQNHIVKLHRYIR